MPPLPFLENEPELPDHLNFEFAAFHEVSRDRNVGFGIGPIPWTSFDRYALRHGIAGDAFDRFVMLMGAMDGAYCKHCQEKNEAEAKANKKS